MERSTQKLLAPQYDLNQPKPVDIKDSRSPLFLSNVREKANLLITNSKGDLETLREAERALFNLEQDHNTDLAGHLAIKLAISKTIINKIDKPIKVGVVVPVFHETNRVLPRHGTALAGWQILDGQESHPHGENFIYEKDKQVEWLTEDNPNVDINIIYADDGCDDKSGKVISDLIAINGYSRINSVIFLDDELKSDDPDMNTALADFDDSRKSQKAGAVYAGMRTAVNRGNDIVVYTDADLSYDLGQLGLLVEPIVTQKNKTVVANRRHPLAYTEDATNHDVYLPEKRRMKAFLGSLRGSLLGDYLPNDTQAGFKAFDAETAKKLLDIPKKDPSMAFDIQLLARQSIIDGKPARSVGVVCIDSPDETTADGEGTYQKMAGKYLAAAEEVGDYDSNDKVIGILEILSGKEVYEPNKAWNLMTGFMRKDEIMLKKFGPDVVNKVVDCFDVDSNNTAVSVELSPEIISTLSHVTNELKDF